MRIGNEFLVPILVQLLVTLLIFRYRCEHCQFDSEKRRVMFDHIRSLHVDTSEIWKCDFCQFETMYKCNLVNHMKKMHTGKKRFQCDFEGCDASFDKFGDMKKHKQIDHAGDVWKYQCHECGKGE